MQLLSNEGVFDQGLKFRSMVLPDQFIEQASPSEMYAAAGLNAEAIVDTVLSLLGVSKISSKA